MANSYNNTSMATEVLAMQEAMKNASIYGFSGTMSPYSAYAAFINDSRTELIIPVFKLNPVIIFITALTTLSVPIV